MINRSLFADTNTTLIRALQLIDENSTRFLMILDSSGKLIGTVTDGDIRRGLLQGKGLDFTVDSIMNRSFVCSTDREQHSNVFAKMMREQILQVPVLDQDGFVVDLLVLDELLAPVDIANSVVVMAGGEGKRLRPHTENCPKPMLFVAGKPMLQILLEQCISSGFRTFYFSVNYLKEQIIDYFGDGSNWGVSIDYLIEDEPLGTAGSLQLLPDSLSSPFLVLNGDVLTRLNPKQLLRFHEENQAHATLCVREHEHTVPFGVVQTNGVELSGFEEKPTYRHLVNAGVYVISPNLLPLLPPHQFTDMPSLLQAAQESGYRVTVCPIHEYWLDVGRPEALEQAHREWSLVEKS
jgi:dTDP-glucose pyrophosphorylase/predicted transcriptional regulator